MRAKLFAMVVTLASLSIGYSSPVCKQIPRPIEPVDSTKLLPGVYAIRFVATLGSQAGNQATGNLWLARTSRADGSPRTGEGPPPHEDLTRIPLFGSLDVDLGAVGAPVDLDDPHAPHPASSDPIRPGVLVHLIDWASNYPRGTPVLTVGSLSKLRADQVWSDGPGIGLWVHQVREQGFSGIWDAWGLLAGGQGYFCAARVSQ